MSNDTLPLPGEAPMETILRLEAAVERLRQENRLLEQDKVRLRSQLAATSRPVGR